MRFLRHVLIPCCAFPAMLGAQLIWQPEGAGTPLHGDGTWDTTTATWTTDINGLDPTQVWTPGEVAHFGADGSGYTVTVGSGISVGGLIIDGTYNHLTFTGSDLALVGATPTITLGADIPTPIFNVGFTGSTGLTVVASDTSSIKFGAASSYTGVTTFDGTAMNSGIEVYVRDANSLGASGSGNGTVANGDVRLIFGGAGPSLTVAENFTLNTSGSVVAESSNVTLTGTVSLGHDLGIDSNGNTLEISGNISESAGGKGLRITDSGTVVLSGTNSFTGDIEVANGSLAVATLGNAGQSGNAGAGTSVILGSDNGEGIDDGELIYTGGTASSDRNLQLAGDISTVNISSLATFLTLSGTVSDGSGYGDHDFEKYGSGRLILTGNNTYSGDTLISNGALIAGSNTALGTGEEVELGTGGTGAGDTLNLLLMGGVTLPQAVHVYNQNSSGYTTLGNYGTGGTATFAGDVYIERSIYIGQNAGGALNFTGNFTDGGTGTHNVIVSGSGKAVFANGIDLRAGTLMADSGETQLRAAANQVYFSGGVSVGSSGTLSGDATIGGGNVLVASGGTIMPGVNGVGTLTMNNLYLPSGGTIKWQLASLATTGTPEIVLAANDINTEVYSSSNLTVDLSLLAVSLRPDYGTPDAFWLTGHTWLVLDLTNAATGNLAPGTADPMTVVNGTWATGSFKSLMDVNGDMVLQFTPVPEPSTYALLFVGGVMAGLGWRRRRA